MALPTSDFQNNLSYKHSLGKVSTRSASYVFEESFKASHNMAEKDVWAETVTFCPTQALADAYVTANPTVLKKYTLQSLTMVPGTNNLSWYISDTGKFIRPFIFPTDVPDQITNAPSDGFLPKLYKSDNSLIPPTAGVFTIDPYSGVIRFQEGSSPVDLGYGIPKITVYVYIGKTVKNLLDGIRDGISWQAPVLSRVKIDPSLLTPVDQDRYIVGIGAIGVWSGKDEQIASWDSGTSSWVFQVPTKGITVYVDDEGFIYNYNGADWVMIVGSSSAINTTVDTTNFNNVLSSSDTDLQKVSDTIDKVIDDNNIYNNKTFSSEKISTIIEEVSGDLTTYINTQNSSLLNYVDNQDQSILVEAKTYTDDVSGDLVSYIDTKVLNPIVETIKFDTSISTPPQVTGQLYWDNNFSTVAMHSGIGNSTLQIGQENWIKVYNNTGSDLLNGTVVYINGASIVCDCPTVAKAIANLYDKSRIIGILTETIPNGFAGFCTSFGNVNNLDTSLYTESDILYLSSTIAGTLTPTKPTDGNFLITVGIVTKVDASLGRLFVFPKSQDYTVEVLQHTGWSPSHLATITLTDTASGGLLSLVPMDTEFYFYQSGNKYNKSSDSIALPDEEGLFLIYYDLGILKYLKNPIDSQVDVIIKNNPEVAYVYWNAVDKKHEYLGYELHPIGMNSGTHAYLHSVLKCRYLSGLSPTGVSADTNGDLTVSAQFGIDSGVIADENLNFSIPSVGSTVGFPIAYLSGTTASPTLRMLDNPGFSVTTAGTGRLAYNQVSGGNYIIGEVPNGDFSCCHLIAINSNDINKRIYAFMGQSSYTTLANARTGAQTELQSLRVIGLLPQEVKAIATFIFETQNGYANPVKSRVRTIATGVNFVDWRNQQIAGVSGGTSTQATIFQDSTFQIYDGIDPTKIIQFEATNISPSTIRTLSVQDKNGFIAIDGEVVHNTGTEVISGDKTFNNLITASGNIKLSSKIYPTTDSMSAIQITKADGLTPIVTISTDPSGGMTINGTLNINGNIIQNGSAYETHAEKLYTKNDLIITRDGAISGLNTGEYTGFQAKLYDGINDGQLVFDKEGYARVGDVGSLQKIATIEETPINTGITYYDNTSKSLKTVSSLTMDISGNIITNNITINGGIKDANINTPIKVGDSLNTSFGTTNKTIVGSINEINTKILTTGTDTKLDTGIPWDERGKFKIDVSYSAPNVSVSISFVGANTSFSYYIKGIKYTVTDLTPFTNKTALASEGVWFVYIYPEGNLVVTKQPWNIYDPDVLLWNFYFNASDNTITWIGEERHTAGRDIFQHGRNHSQGAIYKSGFTFSQYNGITSVNLAANTDNNFGRAMVQLSNGSFWDEDILNSIVHTGASINSTTATPYTDWNLNVQQFLGFTELATTGTNATTIVFPTTRTLVSGQGICVMQGNTTTVRGTTTITTGGTGTVFTVTSVTGLASGDAIVVAARIPIYYLSTPTIWRKLPSASFLGVSGGVAITPTTIATAIAQYNNATAGGFANLTSTRYYPVYLVATNMTSEPVIAILGQGQSTSNALTAALNEAPFQFQNLSGLPSLNIQEVVPIYRLTFQYSSQASFNQSRIRLVNSTFINIRVTTASGSVVGGSPTTSLAAANVTTDTTNFNKILSVTDTTAQISFETIDENAVSNKGIAGGQTIIGGTLTTQALNLRSNATDLTTGAVNFLDTLEASSSTIGAVTIAGGLAVAKRLYATDMTVTNVIAGSITGNAGTVTNGVYTTGAGTVYEVPLTISTGLTRSTNTITNNLSTGLAGGQTIIGGTAASEILTIQSTSNATKGTVNINPSGNTLFGTSGGLGMLGTVQIAGSAIQKIALGNSDLNFGATGTGTLMYYGAASGDTYFGIQHYNNTAYGPISLQPAGGNVLIGTSLNSTSGLTGSSATLAVSAYGQSILNIQSYASNVNLIPTLSLGKSTSETVGTKAVTATGQILGAISFDGVTTASNWFPSVYMQTSQSGNSTATGIPADLQIFTDSGSGLTERFRLTSAGSVILNETVNTGEILQVGGGSNINFNQVSNARNVGLTWRKDSTPYARSAGVYAIGKDTFARKGIAFFVNNSTDYTTDAIEKMRLSSIGNLLINNTSVSIYDTNTGIDVYQYYSQEISSPISAARGQAFGNSATDSTVGFWALNTNATPRKILGSGIRTTWDSVTAGSEAANLAFFTQSAGGSMTEKARISATGKLSVGYSDNVYPAIYAEIKDSAFITSNNSYAVVGVTRFNGTRGGAYSGLLSGEIIGALNFGGTYTTTSSTTLGAYIEGVASGNWTGATAKPTDLLFYTAAATGATSEKLRITGTGNILVNSATDYSYKFQILADAVNDTSDINVGHLALMGKTNPDIRMVMGVDTTSKYGFIESGDAGHAWTSLALQPSGGNVLMGRTTVPTWKNSTAATGLAIKGQYPGNESCSLNIESRSNITSCELATTGVANVDYSNYLLYSGGGFSFYDSTNSKTRFAISKGGDVSIGLTSPFALYSANVNGLTVGSYLSLSSNTSSGWTSLSCNAAQTISANETSGWSYVSTATASRLALGFADGIKLQTAASGTAGTAVAWLDSLCVTNDGRVYGKALHNNAGAVTGTTDQYVASGTYTPTLYATTNVATANEYSSNWTRVGNVVTVSFKVSMKVTTANVAAALGISLPIASSLTGPHQLSGTANGWEIAGLNCSIEADSTNDRALMKIGGAAWGVTSNANPYYYTGTFMYVIL